MRPSSAIENFGNPKGFEYPYRSNKAVELSKSFVFSEKNKETFSIVLGSLEESFTNSLGLPNCFWDYLSWKQMNYKGPIYKFSSHRNPPSKKSSEIEATQLSLPILEYGFTEPIECTAKSEPEPKKKKPVQQPNLGSYLMLPDINISNSMMKKLSEGPRRDSIASFLMMQQLRSHSARVGDHGSEVDFYKPKQLQQDIKKEVSVSSITNPETETVAKVKTERNFEAKKIAEKAAKEGKIFVCNGPYQGLRLSLRKRGWVEKFHTSRENAVNIPKSALMDDEGDKISSVRTEDGVRLAFMSSVVQCHSPTLMFTVKTSEVLSKSLKDNQIVNHFGRATAFTTKVGLSYSLRYSELFTDDLCHYFFPRCYNLSCEEDKQAFIDDYNLTSCMAILKYYVTEHEHITTGNRYYYRHCHGNGDNKSRAGNAMRATESETKELMCLPLMQRGESAKAQKSLPETTEVNQVPGTVESIPVKVQKHVSTKAIRFALDRCLEFIACCKNEDIKKEFEVTKSKWMTSKEKHWLDFQDAYKLYVTNKLRVDKKAKELLPECKKVLGFMETYWPQFNIDGVFNVWILKPGAKSRGRGIKCTSSLPEIINNYTSCSCVTVAQKYIEKPLLIHKTKFDLRQWFLITDWNPLTVWFYKDAYLRFCSKEFTLRDLHESIHLSNNSVQKNYLPSYNRASQLPPDNMWTSDEFKDYLKINKLPNTWNGIIVPGMKKSILNVLFCTQDNIDHRKESFELFGADFMLTEDYRPWLIEINSSPSMARNTRATALLVNRVLEDTVKVVIDRRLNPTCDTGQFELMYKQTKASDHLATSGTSTVPLFITGDKINEVLRN